MFLKVGVPREKLKSREKPSKNFLVHLQAEGLQLFKKWTSSQMLYNDFAKIISYPFIVFFKI